MDNTDAINGVRRALQEIAATPDALSREATTQILIALYERLRRLQTDRPTNDTPPEDEIRLVTVMFVDVVGATHMAEQLGDEAWRLLIREAHRRLADTVGRWDGEVGQYLGDGMLCYFGARRSQGNDAARAVACALAMQARMAEYSARVQNTHKLEHFAVRIGIGTGRAVVGAFGDPDQSTTLAVGSTTNLAARLQALAPPGEIVIDTETYLRVQTEFHTVEQDAVPLKGFRQPVRYYRVAAQRQQTLTHFTTDHIADIPIPFTGRREIYDQLLDIMQQVKPAAGFRAATLYGDIGLGKSRLLQEIAHSPPASRFCTLRMAGHYERRENAFSLLRDLLFTACDLAQTTTESAAEERILNWTRARWHSSADPDAAAAVVGYVAGYNFTDSPYTRTLYSNPMNRNHEVIHRAVLSWLAGVAGAQPLLLLVDNLQWADAQSLDLLTALCEAEVGTVLIAAARPDFQAPAYMRGVSHHIRFYLPPLTPDDTQQLIDALLRRVDNVSDDLRASISQRAEGNPLFVEEFMRMLFDNRVLERNPNSQRWTVNSFRYRTLESDLPNGLLGVFQARLDDLSPPVRRAVQIAAVIGQTFWEGAVRALMNETSAADRIAELVSRGIVVEQPQSAFEGEREYTFRNTLYHEVAYSMLPRTNRVTYHQQVARWLADHTPAKPQMLGVLAGHYLHGDMPLDALRTYTEAAEYQLESGQLTEAFSMYDSGLEAIPAVAVRQDALPYVSRLWLVQARAAHARRRYSEATAASATVLMLMDELPDDMMLNERMLASVTLSNAHTNLGNYYQAHEALQKAERYLTADPMHQAWVKRAFGLLFWSRGDMNKAVQYQREALSAAEHSGSTREIAATLSMLGRIMLDKGNFSSALDYMERVLEINRQAESLLYQVADLRLIAGVLRRLFAYDRALATLDVAEALADQMRYEVPMIQANRGLALIGKGDHAAGVALLHKANENTHLNTHDHGQIKLSHIRGLAQAGAYEACIEAAQPFLEKMQAHSRVLYGRGLLWYGVALHHTGDENAVPTLRGALESELRYGGRDLWLCYYALGLALPDATAAAHHRNRAQEVLDAIAISLYRRPELATVVTDPQHSARVFGRS